MTKGCCGCVLFFISKTKNFPKNSFDFLPFLNINLLAFGRQQQSLTEKVINTQHKKKTPSHTRDGFKLNIECVRKHTLTIKITNIHVSE